MKVQPSIRTGKNEYYVQKVSVDLRRRVTFRIQKQNIIHNYFVSAESQEVSAPSDVINSCKSCKLWSTLTTEIHQNRNPLSI